MKTLNRRSLTITCSLAQTGPPRPRTPGFTLIELLVVISVILILAALILPATMRAQLSAMRANCVSNLRQFGTALNVYHQAYGRYPHQRQTSGNYPGSLQGGPLLDSLADQGPWPVPSSAVGWEFDAVVEAMDIPVPRDATVPLPEAARILRCPVASSYGGPLRETYWPNGTGYCGYYGNARDDCYNYALGYWYVGGAHYFRRADPPMSPTSLDTDPGWALAADIIYWRDGYWIANHEKDEGPRGANVLFADGQVKWYEWNAPPEPVQAGPGFNFRYNNDWGGSGQYRNYWRRSRAEP